MNYMIGTIHVDPQGKERAISALTYFRPDIITYECSSRAHCAPDLASYLNFEHENAFTNLREMRGEIIVNAGCDPRYVKALNKAERTIAEAKGLDLLGAREYARQHKVIFKPIYETDDGVRQQNHYNTLYHMYSKLKEASTTLSKDHFELKLQVLINEMDLLPLMFHQQSKKAYQELRSALQGPVVDPYSHLFDVDQRDEQAAYQWLKIRKAFPATRIVHIGGGAHLLDDIHGRTLYTKIREYPQERYLLNQF